MTIEQFILFWLWVAWLAFSAFCLWTACVLFLAWAELYDNLKHRHRMVKRYGKGGNHDDRLIR